MAFFDFLRRRPTPEAVSRDGNVVGLNTPTWTGALSVSHFGGPVSEESAMKSAAVFRCVTLLSGIVASLDLGVYHDDPDLGRVESESKLNKMLKIRPYPNKAMNAFTMKESLSQNILLHGNGYLVIRLDGAARLAGLEHAPPWIVSVSLSSTGRQVYEIEWKDGRKTETVDQNQIVHVVGPGKGDGLIGQSRIRAFASTSVSLSQSTEQMITKAFDNAITPKTVVEVPSGMSPEAVKRMRAFYERENAGSDNYGRTLFVDAGTKVSNLSISLVDLAIIEASKMSTTSICMAFGVPPFLLGMEQTSAFGAGISQITQGFLRFGLNSELERIEAELTSKLCNGNDYILFDRSQLLQMDDVAAADVDVKLIGCGTTTINESRKARHKSRVEGGDVPFVNSAMISLDKALAQTPAPTGSAQPPVQNPTNPTNPPEQK